MIIVNGVIDAHIHLSERSQDILNRFAKNNGLRYDLEELLSLMKRHGIDQGLLLSPPLEGGKPLPNADIIGLCRRSKGKLSPVVTVEPSKPEVAEGVKIAESNRKVVKGFKIRLGYTSAPASAPVFDGLYDYAESEGLPVMFHTGDTATIDGDLALSHPLTLDRLANKRAGLKIVLCHFGNPWFSDVAELIYKHPNLYADISGLTTGGGAYASKFSRLLAKHLSDAVYFAGGAEKIIFGTDYPVTTYPDALGLVDLLEVGQSDKEAILFRNAKRVFRL